jgi:hypothetical protein
MGARDGEKKRPLPVARAFKLRDKLAAAIDAGKWKKSKRLAIKLSQILVECADPSTCKTGHPHAEGIFEIGWQRYLKAPEDTKLAVRWCNECISYCRALKYSGKK